MGTSLECQAALLESYGYTPRVLDVKLWGVTITLGTCLLISEALLGVELFSSWSTCYAWLIGKYM